MKPGAFFQRLWECFALSVCAVTLAFIGYTTYVRIAQISVDCTHLSEITLLQVWKRETCLKLKLIPGACDDVETDVLYARFDKDLSGAISSVEEVVAFSETAHRYCLDRNVPARTANLVALSCEEMGKNVIQYGFVEGKKNYLEIRIVIRAEEIVIRFRDNCRSFNPKKFYENVYDQNEPLSNFGIRMIMKLSKEVSYTSVLKLNNLMIRL